MAIKTNRRAVFIILISLSISGCSSSGDTEIKITGPDQCLAGERNIFSLDGTYDKSAEFEWKATEGEIEDNRIQAWVTPPLDAESLTVTVIVSGEKKEFTRSYSCDLVHPATVTPLPTPTNTPEPTAPLDEVLPMTIAISEVFADACGDQQADIYYEYVELFNYGDHPVDVKDLWIAVGSRTDTEPQQITSWTNRFPFINLSARLISDSTILQPKSYALIVSPQYPKGLEFYPLPYLYPENTTILTVMLGERLGGAATGIIGSSDYAQRDPVVLYEGSSDQIENVIDTYGAPVVGPNPNLISEKKYQFFPLFLGDCHSATRIEPTQPDTPGNWEVLDPSPGEGY